MTRLFISQSAVVSCYNMAALDNQLSVVSAGEGSRKQLCVNVFFCFVV